MGYNIHLKRKVPIAVTELQQVVASMPNLRLNGNDITVTNPRTGAEVRYPGHPANVQIYVNETAQWQWLFYWSESEADPHIGHLTFRASAISNLQTLAMYVSLQQP